jgi:hypothetical protein
MNPNAVIFRKVLTEVSGNPLEINQKEKAKRIPPEMDISDWKI